jgi:predicted permease
MRWPWSRRDREADLDRELSDHLDLESEARERDALSPANARREARLAFGNPAVIREDVREAWGGMWIERLVADVRYAVRMWARTPGFTLTAVATLSLAIGATTVIFGQINAVFWKPVPVSRPDDLRFLAWTSARPRFVLGPNVLPGPQIGDFQTFGSFSHPAYLAMRDGTRAFSDLACWSDLGEARPIIMGELGFGAVQFVSGNYFQTLGVGASVGRTIQPDDDRPGAWSPVAMISYPFWNRTFGMDPNVTRQTLRLNGRTFAIVGVMPQGFFGLDPSTTPDVVIPMHAVEIAAATQNPLANVGIWNVCRTVGRLAPGASEEQARQEVESLVVESIRQQPPQEPYDPPRVLLADASRGLSTLREGSSGPLFVLLGVVIGLSLAACANIAGLLLARGSARSRELATRLALGAPRMRIVRQLVTESLVLSAAGAVLGLGVAHAMSGVAPRLLSQFLPTLYGADRALSVSAALDVRVLLFAIGAAVAFGMLFGVLPAFRITRIDLIAIIRQAAGTNTRPRNRMMAGQAMVVAQTALALVLLVGAGLFLRTLANLRAADLGFRPEGLVYASIEPRSGGLPTQRRRQFFEEAVRRLERLPGVVSASASSSPPVGVSANTGIISGSPELCSGYDGDERAPRTVTIIGVAPRYFETLGVPLIAGRDFTWADSSSQLLSAIVNDAFVARFLKESNAVGRTITAGYPCGPQFNLTASIVGVVRDTRPELRAPAVPTMYVPLGISSGPVTLMVRTSGSAAAIIPTIRRAMTEMNANIPTFGESTVVDLRERHLRQERLLSTLLIAFGTVTLLVCCLGIYGMLSYSVARRKGEISIRMAIGARAPDVIRLMIWESAVPVAIGVVVGVAAAVAFTRWAEGLLFGVSGFDPLTLGGAALVFLVVAAAAAAVPARAAARVDPVLALRQ